jgi:hypothetical protein
MYCGPGVINDFDEAGVISRWQKVVSQMDRIYIQSGSFSNTLYYVERSRRETKKAEHANVERGGRRERKRVWGGSEGFVATRWSISSTSANLRKKRTTYYVEE